MVVKKHLYKNGAIKRTRKRYHRHVSKFSLINNYWTIQKNRVIKFAVRWFINLDEELGNPFVFVKI